MFYKVAFFSYLQILLQLAKGIFEEQSNLDTCVHNIMVEAQELLDVERCSVFLIDESSETVCININFTCG